MTELAKRLGDDWRPETCYGEAIGRAQNAIDCLKRAKRTKRGREANAATAETQLLTAAKNIREAGESFNPDIAAWSRTTDFLMENGDAAVRLATLIQLEAIARAFEG